MAQPHTPAPFRDRERYHQYPSHITRSPSQAQSINGSEAGSLRHQRMLESPVSRETTQPSLHQPIRETVSQGTASSDPPGAVDTIRLWPLQICFRLAQFLFSLVSFSLVCALQGASGNVALEVRPFAYLLATSLVAWVYSLGVTIFLICTPRWSKYPEWIDSTQKIFLPIDFVVLLLLFSAAATTAAVFPLYCYIGSKARHAMFHGGPTPSYICDDIFESALFGIMGSFAFAGQFWLIVAPFIWERR